MKKLILNTASLLLIMTGGLMAAPQAATPISPAQTPASTAGVAVRVTPAPAPAVAPAAPTPTVAPAPAATTVATAPAPAPVAAPATTAATTAAPAPAVKSVVAAAAPAPAIASNSRPSYASFRLILDRNIFDPSRRPYTQPGGNIVQRTSTVRELFTYRGCMDKVGKGYIAFFDGSGAPAQGGLTVGDTINGFKIKAINDTNVTLVETKGGTNARVYNFQPTAGLYRDDRGPWVETYVSPTYQPPRVAVDAGLAIAVNPFNAPAIPDNTFVYPAQDDTQTEDPTANLGRGNRRQRGGANTGGNGGGRGGRGGRGGGGGGGFGGAAGGGGFGAGGFGGGGFGAAAGAVDDTATATPAAPPDPAVEARLRAARAAGQ